MDGVKATNSLSEIGLSFQFSQQPLSEFVVIHRDGVAGRFDLPVIRMIDFALDQGFNVIRSFPFTGQFARHNFTLQFRSRPDTTDGLEQPDEIQVGNFRVQHPQVQRHLAMRIVDKRLVEKRMVNPIAGTGYYGIIFGRTSIRKVYRVSIKSLDVWSWFYFSVPDEIKQFAIQGWMVKAKIMFWFG